MVAIWRAVQNKTANAYFSEIAVKYCVYGTCSDAGTCSGANCTVLRSPLISRRVLTHTSGYNKCVKGVFRPIYLAISPMNAVQLYVMAFHTGEVLCKRLIYAKTLLASASFI